MTYDVTYDVTVMLKSHCELRLITSNWWKPNQILFHMAHLHPLWEVCSWQAPIVFTLASAKLKQLPSPIPKVYQECVYRLCIKQKMSGLNLI